MRVATLLATLLFWLATLLAMGVLCSCCGEEFTWNAISMHRNACGKRAHRATSDNSNHLSTIASAARQAAASEGDAAACFEAEMKETVVNICGHLRYPSGGHPIPDHAITEIKMRWQEELKPLITKELTRRVAAQPEIARNEGLLAATIGEVLQMFRGLETKAREVQHLKDTLPYVKPVRTKLGAETMYSTDAEGMHYSSGVVEHYVYHLEESP